MIAKSKISAAPSAHPLIVLPWAYKLTMETDWNPVLHFPRNMIALLRLLMRLCFRFRAYNERVLREPGPVLLLANHTSWFDWLLLGVCLDEDWRFVTSSDTARITAIKNSTLSTTIFSTLPICRHSSADPAPLEALDQVRRSLVLAPTRTIPRGNRGGEPRFAHP